jgi:hypothetical protein
MDAPDAPELIGCAGLFFCLCAKHEKNSPARLFVFSNILTHNQYGMKHLLKNSLSQPVLFVYETRASPRANALSESCAAAALAAVKG